MGLVPVLKGCPLILGGVCHVADDRLPAGVNVNVLNNYLLFSPALQLRQRLGLQGEIAL